MFGWFTKGGPQNFSGYDSDEVDGIPQKARTSEMQADRAELYRQAQRRIAQDAPDVICDVSQNNPSVRDFAGLGTIC